MTTSESSAPHRLKPLFAANIADGTPAERRQPARWDAIPTELKFSEYEDFRNGLFNALSELTNTSSWRERAWFSKMITEMLSHLMPDVALPDDPLTLQAVSLWLAYFERSRIQALGVAKSAPGLEAGALMALREEATSLKPSGTHAASVQVYSEVGPAAQEYAQSPEFLDWVETKLGIRIDKKVYCKYIHYETAGQRCHPHVDQPGIYEFNCLVCVDARPPIVGLTSVLRLFLPTHFLDIRPTPGASIVFHAAATVHGRTPLGPGEAVTMLSVGMNAM